MIKESEIQLKYLSNLPTTAEQAIALAWERISVLSSVHHASRVSGSSGRKRKGIENVLKFEAFRLFKQQLFIAFYDWGRKCVKFEAFKLFR